jgi:hypothetical protein
MICNCGYEFDADRLGRFGCPNCEGEAAPVDGKYTPIAYCTWHDLIDGVFEPDDEPRICRASIGAKRITVWLPRGAVIRLGRPWRAVEWGGDSGRYAHYYRVYGVLTKIVCEVPAARVDARPRRT